MPMHASTGPGRILTTHVGSLIRPPELQKFLVAQRDKQQYDEARFATCLHDCVADVVRKQVEIGLDIVNDGEYGKTISWSRYVLQRMSGFEQRDRPGHAGMPAAVAGRDRREFAEFYADYDRHQGFTGMTGWDNSAVSRVAQTLPSPALRDCQTGHQRFCVSKNQCSHPSGSFASLRKPSRRSICSARSGASFGISGYVVRAPQARREKPRNPPLLLLTSRKSST